MDTNRLNQGEMIAAVSALLLLIIMFVFSWFGIPDVDVSGIDDGFNAWQSFDFIDIVLFITILVAIGGALMTATAQSANTPVAISAITTALGILSVLLILFRIIDPPGVDISGAFVDENFDFERRIGVFLGLIAAGGIAFGGWRAMQEEGTSFGGEADRVQNRGGGDGTPPAAAGGPPPPPPPPAGGNPPPSGGTGV